ncbi:MAG: hypothetical protein DRH44_06695 [Candidatus Coatesbacteria bacterium]|nr:MAG: hypothetical protein DRH44_06695 [Candidatus Coatesbacteria bacterium]
MIRMDLHTHSKFSDGTDLPEVLVEAGIDVCLTSIAITDHVRADSDWVWHYIDYMEEVREYYGDRIRVLSGVEAKVVDFNGTLDMPEGVEDFVDIVLSAVHRVPKEDGGFLTDDEIASDGERALNLWARAVVGAIKNPSVAVIAHPGLIMKNHGIEITEEVAEKVAKAAGGEAVAFEYNVGWGVPEGCLLNGLMRHGVSFTVGSDAHSADELREVWGDGGAGGNIPDEIINRLVIL